MAMTGRFYSATRRIQQLIGKMPDGTAIWGGPYTITQVVTTVVVVLALFFSLGLFGIGTAKRVVTAVIIGVAIGWSLGKIPTPRRPLMSTADALMAMALHGRRGRVGGRELETHPVVSAGLKRARQANQRARQAERKTARATKLRDKTVDAHPRQGDKTGAGATGDSITAAPVTGGAARLLAVGPNFEGGHGEKSDHGDS